jgi:hypothetical protein
MATTSEEPPSRKCAIRSPPGRPYALRCAPVEFKFDVPTSESELLCERGEVSLNVDSGFWAPVAGHVTTLLVMDCKW